MVNSSAYANGDAKELQIVRAVILRGLDEATPDALRVRLWVKNNGENDIKVLTRNLQCTLFNYDDRPKELSIDLSAQMNIDGASVIPSLYDFSPVTLKPGEIAEIQVEYRDRTNLEHVILIYDMRNNIARRFSAWDGMIQSEVVEVMQTKRNR